MLLYYLPHRQVSSRVVASRHVTSQSSRSTHSSQSTRLTTVINNLCTFIHVITIFYFRWKLCSRLSKSSNLFNLLWLYYSDRAQKNQLIMGSNPSCYCSEVMAGRQSSQLIIKKLWVWIPKAAGLFFSIFSVICPSQRCKITDLPWNPIPMLCQLGYNKLNKDRIS